jgi:hypothetical protein
MWLDQRILTRRLTEMPIDTVLARRFATPRHSPVRIARAIF